MSMLPTTTLPRTRFRPSAKVRRVFELLAEAGATDCLLVGGCVRDFLLGLKSKDVDIEVYGLNYQEILKTLQPHFCVNLVGQSFATFKIGSNIDLSLPRTESKSGRGHKGFSVEADPLLDPRVACSRRDFTINAIGMRLDGSLVDPFDGQEDLRRGILRAPTEAFCEDPLRVLRAMQFAARFGFSLDSATVDLCKRVRPEFETLSAERIWGEWQKWAKKGRFPGHGLRVLQETTWIECFPELAALVGTPQNPRFHPEGDVFEHTVMASNAAAKIADELKLSIQDRCILMLGILCHDFGKPAATFLDEEGNWRSPHHSTMGVEPTQAFFDRMKAPKWAAEHIVPLVREHMAHMAIPWTTDPTDPSDSSVRRLAVRLAPANIALWAALCKADAMGCGGPKPHYRSDDWEKIAQKLELREKKPQPILLGRHLLEHGIEPGKKMGEILHQAFEAQLDGAFSELEEAERWLQSLPRE